MFVPIVTKSDIRKKKGVHNIAGRFLQFHINKLNRLLATLSSLNIFTVIVIFKKYRERAFYTYSRVLSFVLVDPGLIIGATRVRTIVNHGNLFNVSIDYRLKSMKRGTKGLSESEGFKLHDALAFSRCIFFAERMLKRSIAYRSAVSGSTAMPATAGSIEMGPWRLRFRRPSRVHSRDRSVTEKKRTQPY